MLGKASHNGVFAAFYPPRKEEGGSDEGPERSSKYLQFLGLYELVRTVNDRDCEEVVVAAMDGVRKQDKERVMWRSVMHFKFVARRLDTDYSLDNSVGWRTINVMVADSNTPATSNALKTIPNSYPGAT